MPSMKFFIVIIGIKNVSPLFFFNILLSLSPLHDLDFISLFGK